MKGDIMTVTAATVCRHCGREIRRDKAGYWGARNRGDPHPRYCDANPAAARRHEPATPVAALRAGLLAMGVTADSPARLDAEGERIAREERWN